MDHGRDLVDLILQRQQPGAAPRLQFHQQPRVDVPIVEGQVRRETHQRTHPVGAVIAFVRGDRADQARKPDPPGVERRMGGFFKEVQPAHLGRQADLAKRQREGRLAERHAGGFPRGRVGHREGAARFAQQRHRLLGARPRQGRPHLQQLPGISFAEQDALFRIERLLLQGLQEGGRRHGAGQVSPAQHPARALQGAFRRAHVQPVKPFRGTAQSHAKLVDRQALAEVFEFQSPPALANRHDAVQPLARFQYAHGLEVQALGFEGGEHARPQRFGDVGRNLVSQSDQGQSLALGEALQQVLQLRPRLARAQEHLVARIHVDFGLPGSAGALALVDRAVEIPDAVHEVGNAPRAAQIGLQFEIHRRGQAEVQEVLKPAPLEVGGAHRLRLVAGGQQAHTAAHRHCQFHHRQRFDGREILHLVDGDTVEVRQRPGPVRTNLRDGFPGEVQLAKETRFQGFRRAPAQRLGHLERGLGRSPADGAFPEIAILAGRDAPVREARKAPQRDRQQGAEQVRVQLVVERRLLVEPRAENRGGKARNLLDEGVAGGAHRLEGDLARQQLAQKPRVGDHLKPLVARREFVEMIPRQGGQFRRVGDVQDGLAPGQIGRVPQRRGLSGPGVAFDDADLLPGLRKVRLGGGPRRRNVVLLAQLLDADGEIAFGQRVRLQRPVVVVMPYVAQEHGPRGRVLEFRNRAQRRRALGGPPCVEMAAVIAAQRRTAPAPVIPLGRLVVLPPHVHQQPVQQQGRPPAHRVGAVLSHLFQEFLVAEQRIARACGRLLFVQASLELRTARHKTPSLTQPRPPPQPGPR